MRQRNSVCRIQKRTTKLRRSPRFLQKERSVRNRSDDPETPNLERRRSWGSYSDHTSLSSFQEGSLNKPQKQERGEVTEKEKGEHFKPKSSMKLSAEQRRLKNGVSKDTHCLRRSPRFSGNCDAKGICFEDPKQDNVNEPRKQRRGEVSEKGREPHFKRKNSTKLSSEHPILKSGISKDPHCLRRSPVLLRNCNVQKIHSEDSKRYDFRPKSSRKLSSEQETPGKLDGVSRNSHCLPRSSEFSEDCKSTGYEDHGRQDLNNLCRNSGSGITRPLTRGFVKRNNEEGSNGCGNGVVGGIPSEVVDVERISDKPKAKEGADLSEQCLYKIEKRITRSSTRGTECEDIQKYGNCKGEKPIKNALFESLDEGGFSDEENGEVDMKSSKQCIRKSVNNRNYGTSLSAECPRQGDRKGFLDEVEKNLVGKKRQRNEAKAGHRIVQGWTGEQELALQRAYFATKPTPHFWKKVSKMVPGKSAQDCFDKIHSDYLTPPQPQPRSRTKARSSSSLSFPASTLLTFSEPKSKKPRNSKQKSFLSHKAVRGLLQKQCKVDKDYEADLFTVLEPTLDPSIRVIPDRPLFSTPECNKKASGSVRRCLEGSSSAHRKHLSHLDASRGPALTSPPVLKPVKNRALHDRYIDQLHIREAKRKAASVRALKCIQRKNDAKPNDLQHSEVVKAAKDALIIDASEAIGQFNNLRNSMTDDDVYDDFADSAEADVENGS